MHKMFIEANEDWERGRLELAFNKFKELAEQGDTSSQNNLGVFYEEGIGVSRDIEKAIYWYEKALEGNEYSALSNLAILYVSLGKSDDAITLYKKAVALGDGDSMVELGELYLNKTSECHDKKLARKCFEEALTADDITPDSLEKAQNYLKGMN